MVEDSKVPDRPFGLKCPKCQNLVRLPGRGAEAPASASPPASSPVNGSAVAGPGTPQAQGPASPEALPGPEASNGPLAVPAARSGSQGSALVALSDRGQAEAMALTLSRQGYTVTNLSDMDDAVRLLEQGVYGVVVTTRAAASPGNRESLYQRILRLAPEPRRRLFVILVGDEFRTGEATQAFAALSDLVANGKELGGLDDLLRKTVVERSRLYQVFLDTLAREEGRR